MANTDLEALAMPGEEASAKSTRREPALGLPPRPRSAPSTVALVPGRVTTEPVCGAAGAGLLRCRSQGAIRKARPQSAIASGERRLPSEGAGRRDTSDLSRSRTRSREGSEARSGSKSEAAFHGHQTFAEGVYAYSQRRGAAARRNLMSFTPMPAKGFEIEKQLGTTRAPSPFMPGGRCVTFGEAMHVYNTRGFGVMRGSPMSRAASLPRLPKAVACA